MEDNFSKLLRENMRRFGTKNLNEEVLQNKFYIYYEMRELSNSMYLSYKMPRVTTLNDKVDDYDSYGPTTDSIVFELLGYDPKQKNADYKNTLVDDYIAAIDDWYTHLQELAMKSGLTVPGQGDEEYGEGDEWKALMNNDDEDDDADSEEQFITKPSQTTIKLRNGKIVDIKFIKGSYNGYDSDAIYECVVRNNQPVYINN
jgi:hypothetical protein